MKFSRFAFLLALLPLLLSGCTDLLGSTSTATPEQVLPTVTVRAGPQSFEDQTIVQVITDGPTDYTYHTEGGSGSWRVGVFDGDERITYLYEYGSAVEHYPTGSGPATIPAGEHIWTFHWNGHTEARATEDPKEPHDGDRVPPGTYTIRVEHTSIPALVTQTTVTVEATA